MNIKNMSKQELVSLLKQLKLYREIRKKIWKRWSHIFKKMIWKTTDVKVEYAKNVEENFAKIKAWKILKNIFWLSVEKDEIISIKKDNLIGWIKIYVDDNMIDLSFLKFYNTLK